MREPQIGDIVHFMYGGVHLPAIVSDPAFHLEDRVWQAMTVFLINAAPFTTVALHEDEVFPGTWNNATWHWSEAV